MLVTLKTLQQQTFKIEIDQEESVMKIILKSDLFLNRLGTLFYLSTVDEIIINRSFDL